MKIRVLLLEKSLQYKESRLWEKEIMNKECLQEDKILKREFYYWKKAYKI